ncbi:MAG: ABC transporter substrate-binding protein, partial [Clostridia bacterium]|nr:ABC transporter substrate-binding protein [Clostridia bacterium]
MKKIMAIFLMLLIGISGCGTRDNNAGVKVDLESKFDDSIIVGVVGTMWIMEDASKYLDGVRLAVEEINADGGINNRDIKTLELDDQGQTMEGIKIAQELVKNSKLRAVIGHWDSHVTLPAASIYENAGVLMMTAMATTPELTQNGYKYIFRNVPSDEIMGGEMAAFASKQGLKRIAIYYSDTDYGRGLANSFEKVAQSIDVKVVDRTTCFLNDDDFERTMERWKAFDFDGVFIADCMPDAGGAIKRIKEVYPDIPIMGTDGLDSPDFISVLGDAAEGIFIATLLDPDDDNPELVQFIN